MTTSNLTLDPAAASAIPSAIAGPEPKRVEQVHSAPERHWVGDGFPVHNLFGYGPGAEARSPFLMLDYATPYTFAPNVSAKRRGVGAHPHRGFETVTIVLQGEVAHRDSAGGGGVIGPGDVQWMTAASGVLHDEFHTERFDRDGGPFQVVQLWVNLPASHKMSAPRYQAIEAASIPTVPLPGGASVRLIAGVWEGDLAQVKATERGPAQTVTPMNVWLVDLPAGSSANLPQANGWTTLVAVLDGEARLQDRPLKTGQWAQLSREGEGVHLQTHSGARLLLLAGEPIDEPIAGYGPFVMNTREEIAQAVADLQAGAFGTLD